MIVWSPAPLSASSVISVCRVSWNRPSTPVRVFTFFHAVLRLVTGLVGTRGRSLPRSGFPTRPGKTYHCGSIEPKRFVYQREWSTRAEKRLLFSGIVRPSPASVLLRPTVRNRLSKSICAHVRFRISASRIPALKASCRAGRMYGDRDLAFVASPDSGIASARRSAFCSSVYAFPADWRTLSLRFFWRRNADRIASPRSPSNLSKKPTSSLMDFGAAFSFNRATWYCLTVSGESVVDPFFWTRKRPFLRWWAALKIEESQCPKPARVTHPA